MQKWILIASFRHRADIFDILDKDISLSMNQIKEDENDDGIDFEAFFNEQKNEEKDVIQADDSNITEENEE